MRPSFTSISGIAAFLVGSLMTVASVDAQTTNGCGTGWNRYLVPNSLPLGVCEFKVSCDTHDHCYAKCLLADSVTPSSELRCKYLACLPGGALANDRVTCETPEYVDSLKDARLRRKTCDLAFYDDLNAQNSNRWVCRAFASLYRKAVEQFGETAFAGVAPLGSQIVAPGNEAAIREFLEKANDDQFKKLIEQLKRDQLDLLKPLRLDKDKGLVYDQ